MQDIESILLSRLGLEINFIQWMPLRSSNDRKFVAVALFVVTPAVECLKNGNYHVYRKLFVKDNF